MGIQNAGAIKVKFDCVTWGGFDDADIITAIAKYGVDDDLLSGNPFVINAEIPSGSGNIYGCFIRGMKHLDGIIHISKVKLDAPWL